jgi:transketolase
MLTRRNTLDTVDLAKRIGLHALRMTSLGGTSHIGSVFSMTDLLAVLYGRILRIEATSPQWPNRDRFILSKRHAGAGVYAAVAECGFFEVSVLDSHVLAPRTTCASAMGWERRPSRRLSAPCWGAER